MRNYCEKCKYEIHDDDDYGCVLFGIECTKCKSFNEDEMGCNVHPKKMAYLINQENKRFIAWNKRDYKENKLVKHYSILPKEERGYKAYRNDGTWMGFWTDDYRPNMKGGHRHNHIYNVCYRITFRGKYRKRLSREDKKHFVENFWANIRLMPDELNNILANRIKRK